MQERAVIGSFPWYGAWGDLAAKTSAQPYHGPFVLPPMAEGEPTTKPLAEDAAHFLIRQVHAHPHQVTIYAAGPLTNIALALAIDPEFAQLTQGITIMGGSLSPQTDDPEFATHSRHEFNFWFDPEAAHIVLRAHWPRIDLTTVDISVKAMFTQPMLDEISRAKTHPPSTSPSTHRNATTSGMNWPPPPGWTPPSSPRSANSTLTSISPEAPPTATRSPGQTSPSPP
jgi:inosine-uridine nucleoside N-ribohydrolase